MSMFIFIKSLDKNGHEDTFEPFPMLLSDIRFGPAIESATAGYYIFSISCNHQNGTKIYSKEFQWKKDAEMALFNCVSQINAIKIAYEKYIHGAHVHVPYVSIEKVDGKIKSTQFCITESNLDSPCAIEI